MQSLESLMQVQMTQQIIKLLNSIQSVTIGGLTLDANLKTRVQVVSNSAQENLTKDQQSQNQNQANTKNANSNKALNQQNSTNQTNTAKAPLTNAQVADAKVANANSNSNSNSKTYNVILKLMDGRNINVNLPKPLPVGAKLELVMGANNKGALRPLPNLDKPVQAQAQNLSQNQATNKPILTQEQLQNALTQNLTKALPKQMPLNEFLQQLQTSITKIATQPNVPYADKIAIRQALRQILQHFPQKNDSVPTAQEIKNAIKNNGVLFEANLAKLANFSTAAPTNSPVNSIVNIPTNITLDLKFLLQRASILLQNSLANAGNAGAKSASFQTNANQANTNFAGANQNIGANLANTANLNNLANLANQAQNSQSLLQAQAQSQAQSSSANAQNNAQVNAQANQTNANAQNAGANTNAQNTQTSQAQANQSSSNEVLQQVNKLLDSAMAKIQTQQHTALQQTNTADNRGVTQNLQVSIPFFAGGTWQNVDLELNKLDSENSSNSTSETNRREKIWQVTLNFALRDWGKISTRLVLRGENLRADLWLETDDKRQKMELASESLTARLRSIGAEVEKITFHTGAIVKQQQKISGTDQLIDTLV